MASQSPRINSKLPARTATSKRSSFACTNCRRKKIRCDGAHPSCRTCVLYQASCTYELPPSLSYVRFLESRITSLEDYIRQLALESDDARDRLLRNSVIADQVVISPEHQDPLPDHFDAGVSEPHGSPHEIVDLRIGSEGEVGHHGLTSFYTLPTLPSIPTQGYLQASHSANSSQCSESHEEMDFGSPPPDRGSQSVRTRLIQSALEQRPQEVLALSKVTSGVAEFPLEMYEYLLQCHWKWIQPFYNFIYRPAFTRDMGRQSGQYFSPFLFFCVIAHSARFCKSYKTFQNYAEGHIVGDFFLSKAKDFLSAEIENPGITTVQGLLLLSANAGAMGQRSQSWTYSGMAFRIMTDLGLHLNNAKVAASSNLSEEDLEVRRRLFWSAYLWDKMTSLYLGRTPALSNSVRAPPPIILDDSEENELWVPFLTHEAPSPDGSITKGYSPTPTRGISTFISACSLAEILDKVIRAFYCVDPRQSLPLDSRRRTADKITADLRAWRKKLPDSLWFDTTRKLEFPPPSHISNLNSLYHTSTILANRPCLISEPDDLELQSRCLEAASSILYIVRLWCSSFGECRFMIVAYSVYTAATVFLVLLQRETSFQRSDGAENEERDRFLAELRFCHLFLMGVTATCPGIQIPARAIKQYVDHLSPRTSSSRTRDPHIPVGIEAANFTSPNYGTIRLLPQINMAESPSWEALAQQTTDQQQQWESPPFQDPTINNPSIPPRQNTDIGNTTGQDEHVMFEHRPCAHQNIPHSSFPRPGMQRNEAGATFRTATSEFLFPGFMGQDPENGAYYLPTSSETQFGGTDTDQLLSTFDFSELHENTQTV